MNWDDYWLFVEEINKTGKPEYEVGTIVDEPGHEFMAEWVKKWYRECSYLEVDGCGCCYSDYRIAAPEAAIKEIVDNGIEVREYEEPITTPIKTGVPSSFLEFSKCAEDRKIS